MALLVLVSAVSARAQSQSPPEEPARNVEFMSRTAFHMNAEHLSGDDPRYVWDADFGGELDVVDYGVGRFTFEANYQVVLGEEIRSFDPNQGNYILAGNVSGTYAGLRNRGAAVSPVTTSRGSTQRGSHRLEHARWPRA